MDKNTKVNEAKAEDILEDIKGQNNLDKDVIVKVHPQQMKSYILEEEVNDHDETFNQVSVAVTSVEPERKYATMEKVAAFYVSLKSATRHLLDISSQRK